ncbi:hypothetical protein Ccrd_019516 [Cynara cardunculus var. scolymus]|uniref:Uncharacterized protein n=1 Tax=Cynara cardunculus var. scolymus TaxID=59895 RepID=A0A124SF59_CYNCS|nr:hypothetical protein Ccrd_019516 [Cynara cardunculus var. scolymus]
MENHRRQKAHSTGDMFTFPAISQDIDFDSELADQLFSNGNYGRSQRWQFIAPVPVLNRRNSLKKRKGGNGKQDCGVRKGICRRFLGWLVSTCQECHAIEPSKRLKVSM